MTTLQQNPQNNKKNNLSLNSIAWQKKQKALGNCIVCGKEPSSTNKTLCEKHRDMKNARSRKYGKRDRQFEDKQRLLEKEKEIEQIKREAVEGFVDYLVELNPLKSEWSLGNFEGWVEAYLKQKEANHDKC